MAWVHGCVRPVDQAAICGGILRLKLSGNLKCNVYLFVAIFFWGILMEAAVYNKYAWFHSQLWLCWAYIKNFLWWLEDIFCSQWLFKHQSEESLERPRVEAIWEVPSHSFLWPPLLTIVNRSSFASKEGGWGRPRLVWADKGWNQDQSRMVKTKVQGSHFSGRLSFEERSKAKDVMHQENSRYMHAWCKHQCQMIRGYFNTWKDENKDETFYCDSQFHYPAFGA